MYEPYEHQENYESAGGSYPQGGAAQEPVSNEPTGCQMAGAGSFYESPYGAGYHQPPVAPKPKKPKKNTGKIIALALCCSLVGGLVGAGGVALAGSLGGEDTVGTSGTTTLLEGQRNTSLINVAQIDTSEQMTAAEVYAANVNSTVGITTSITTNYWGYQTTSAASGSGFILTADGYILTNYHVIESSDSIKVTMYDGTAYDATVVGVDSSNDIAVLKIDAEGLTPVVLGDSDNLNVGDPVVAIGNPLGELTFSLTSGAVSALEREITLSSSLTMNLIQTDCAINSGNSGGALFNLYGEVVGITNAKYSGSGSSSEASIDNIGFAIPINQVRSIVESIIENGYIVKPYIGVSVKDVSDEMQSYGLPQGAVVYSVTEGGPASKAGLQANDIITEANGEAITGSKQLVELVGDMKGGDQLTLKVYRQGQTMELTVTVLEQKQSALQEEQDTTDDSQEQQGVFPWSWPFGG